MTTVLIGADICPIGENLPNFTSGNAEALLHDLLPEFQAADLAVANLECPFISGPSPIKKAGPVFGAPSAAVNGIKAAGIGLLGLANNHILDHGPEGLANTLAVCRQAGIDTVGAGENLAAAGEMFIKNVGGKRIAFLAVAEREFTIAEPDSAGANPLDIIDFIRRVNAARGSFDYLIVLVHGGHEFFVPTPRIQKTCRFMIESGANAVIVQHPHFLGGYEEYRGGHIVYGQGALVMDEAIYRELESFHEGFLVKLSIASDNSSKMQLIPFNQSDPAPGARRFSPEKEKEFQRKMAEKFQALLNPAYVKEEWVKFCEEQKHDYMNVLLGLPRLLRGLNRRGGLAGLLYNNRVKLYSRNIVSCETHREVINTIFAEKLV